MNNRLYCTFTTNNDVLEIVEKVKHSYVILFNKIFVLESLDREKTMLNNAVRKQKDFMNGDVKKSNMSKADRKKVNAISKSGASAKEVGKGANGN